ncbi:hypothetical protein BKA69DRAFT_1122077 [Paraphysoderma sedebokerense]|nr:hypothetical protein BKA69DRAFT_1122077 [Paraphysoderma sedebokerense]
MTTFKSRNLKSICTVLMFIGITIAVIYMWGATYLKYAEGFYAHPLYVCIAKPAQLWSPYHKQVQYAFDWIFTFAMSIKTSVVFTMMAFFNYLSTTVGQASFYGSRELLAYKIYAVIGVIMYPILTGPFMTSGSPALILMPQFRLQTQMQSANVSVTSNNSKDAANRISYYITATTILAFTCFLEGFCLGVLNIDFFTGKVLYFNKFATDFLTKLINFGTHLFWPVIFHILYPLQGSEMSPHASATSKSNLRAGLHSNVSGMKSTGGNNGVTTLKLTEDTA